MKIGKLIDIASTARNLRQTILAVPTDRAIETVLDIRVSRLLLVNLRQNTSFIDRVIDTKYLKAYENR